MHLLPPFSLNYKTVWYFWRSWLDTSNYQTNQTLVRGLKILPLTVLYLFIYLSGKEWLINLIWILLVIITRDSFWYAKVVGRYTIVLHRMKGVKVNSLSSSDTTIFCFSTNHKYNKCTRNKKICYKPNVVVDWSMHYRLAIPPKVGTPTLV